MSLKMRHAKFGPRSIMLRVAGCVLLVLICGGCMPAAKQVSSTDGDTRAASQVAVDSPIASGASPQGEAPAPGSRDPLPTPRKLYEISIYLIAVPAGAISGNADFWKRIDENVLDPVTMQTLQWNGIRVGLAPASEFEHLQRFIDDPEATRSTVVANNADNLELPVASGIVEQDLWWLNRRGELTGRTYQDCDNLFYFRFRQPFRKPDKVEVAIAPAVRGRRARIDVIPRTGEQREIRYEKPETLYDLGLQCDIPLGQMLIIAPSPQWRDAINVGRVFFTRDDPAQQMERIIVVVPGIKGTMRPTPVAGP